MKKALVTGGAGFIGSHLCEALAKTGCEVMVLDDLSTGKSSNLASVMGIVNLVEGDVQDEAVVTECMTGVDVVFHLAALVSVPASIENPKLSARINDLGTLNVFAQAAKAGVKRVVYSSSSAVYGDEGSPPHKETAATAPASPYAAHKLLGEYYADLFRKTRGMETVSLRYFNVYGPRQDPSSPYSGVISIFFDRLLRGDRADIYGDGEQTRDFVYVADVVRANLAAATVALNGDNVFNVGTGSAVSINELYATVGDLTDSTDAPNHLPPRAGDVRHSVADTGRAEKLLGFKTKKGLPEGLAALYAHERKKLS